MSLLKYIKMLFPETNQSPVAIDPITEMECFKDMGNDLFKQESYKAALRVYGCAISASVLFCKLDNPDNAEVDPSDISAYENKAELALLAKIYSNRANCHSKLGDLESSWSCALLATKLDPNYVKGHFWLVFNAIQTKKHHLVESSIEVLKMAPEKDQDIKNVLEDYANRIENKRIERD